MIKNINVSELTTILWGLEGKNILVKTGSMGFTFKSFGILNNFSSYTYGFKIEMENGSTIELDNDNIEYINHDTELTRNNTNKIKVKLKNGQLLGFEFEVLEEEKTA